MVNYWQKGVPSCLSIATPVAPNFVIKVLPPANSIASLVSLGSLVRAIIQPPPPAPVNFAPRAVGAAALIKLSNSGLGDANRLQHQVVFSHCSTNRFHSLLELEASQSLYGRFSQLFQSL